MTQARDLLLLMEQAFSGFEEATSGLSPAEWDRPTDCPGWSIKDLASHLCGIESLLLGAERPQGDLPRPAHVRNDLGALNEAQVGERRARPGESVLEEYRDLTTRRLGALAAFDEAAWSKETMGPFGPTTMDRMIAIRILDVYYHEQDARRSLGRPGHLEGAVARHCFETIAAGLPMSYGKRVAPPEGTAFGWDVKDPGRWIALTISGGRAVPASEAPASWAEMDCETFLLLAGGRRTAERALAEGRVALTGDRALGERVLASMVVVP